jgi:adenylate kinase family enzyme
VNPLTLIFLGPQGCGKGTHVELLTEYLKSVDPHRSVYFSAGKTLREFASKEGYTASLIKPAIARGELLPLFLTAGLWAHDLVDNLQGNEHLFIDGFPRMFEQIPILDSAIQFYKRESPTVVYINISDEEAIQRLLLRNRTDDTKEGIQKRLAWTREQTGKINAWFQGNPAYTFIEIHGEKPIDVVQHEIREKLGLK